MHAGKMHARSAVSQASPTPSRAHSARFSTHASHRLATRETRRQRRQPATRRNVYTKDDATVANQARSRQATSDGGARSVSWPGGCRKLKVKVFNAHPMSSGQRQEASSLTVPQARPPSPRSRLSRLASHGAKKQASEPKSRPCRLTNDYATEREKGILQARQAT
ncbi:uncharacterized protein BKA78DRAFT_75639 [Phyllosticta capitalensis]|uniref:uncharacterized protein n=1 Tax=Phyllosticta capitalensis TaxID=121624 RepID=UPI00313139E5